MSSSYLFSVRCVVVVHVIITLLFLFMPMFVVIIINANVIILIWYRDVNICVVVLFCILIVVC